MKIEIKISEILLIGDEELNKNRDYIRNERIKHVKMTSHMQNKLQEQAQKLRTTQGLLIGAGLLFSLIDKE